MIKKSRKIVVGNVPVGGDSPVTIQSMTNTVTKDVESTVAQILRLEEAGCDLSRSAVNTLEDAKAIPLIKERTHIPFIADIQFNHKLALYAVEYGCDAIRINPGNIGGKEKVAEVVKACKERNIPMRIGVNSGSVHQDMIERYHGVNVESLVQSALYEIKTIEDMGYDMMKVSIKSSHVPMMIAANRRFRELSDYPLHLGVTEAGPSFSGTIKSAIGIGSLLADGIGDTIRVSITGDPVEEVRIAKEILKSLQLRTDGVDLISCPTCARTRIDLIAMVKEAQRRLEEIDKNISVAIMGCPVNGPGEAKEADIGISGGNGMGFIFKKGEILRRVPEDQLLDSLFEEIEKM